MQYMFGIVLSFIVIIHQNVKLMLCAVPINEDYKTLIAKTVWSMDSKDRMLHRCEMCPGVEPLQTFLNDAFTDYNPEETIEFKQWVDIDRDTLCMK